jgi:hypothetical protein
MRTMVHIASIRLSADISQQYSTSWGITRGGEGIVSRWEWVHRHEEWVCPVFRQMFTWCVHYWFSKAWPSMTRRWRAYLGSPDPQPAGTLKAYLLGLSRVTIMICQVDSWLRQGFQYMFMTTLGGFHSLLNKYWVFHVRWTTVHI